MKNIPDIAISAYDYDLPQERIAQYPLSNRDHSKLLIYRGGEIEETHFSEINGFLPANSMLIYNETKVVRARIPFRKKTGAKIEIFCLEPVQPSREIQEAFAASSPVVWKVLVGNSKKWKDGLLSLPFARGELRAERIRQESEYSLVRFSWNPAGMPFSAVLEEVGKVPLPPYMKREAEDLDKQRYQTVFARQEGSVAAPTAGLHFTENTLEKIKRKGIQTASVTLHVGAGTFKPVTAGNISGHRMHSEQIIINKSTIEDLMNAHHRNIIAVGTTSVRTLESLYWHGVKLLRGEGDEEIDIRQWDPYRSDLSGVASRKALSAILQNMEENNRDMLTGSTELMIAPSYQYRIVDSLITNFHQPKSTLLLLVSALIGEDWKKVYEYALQHDFRFLSYGDACLFLLNKG